MFRWRNGGNKKEQRDLLKIIWYEEADESRAFGIREKRRVCYSESAMNFLNGKCKFPRSLLVFRQNLEINSDGIVPFLLRHASIQERSFTVEWIEYIIFESK